MKAILVLLGSAVLPLATLAGTPVEIATSYAAAAGNAASAERGRQLFTTTHGREWSCAACLGRECSAQEKGTLRIGWPSSSRRHLVDWRNI
jgi:hypothetical protein